MLKNRKAQKDKRLKNSIFSFGRFLLYFTITGFVVTVSFFLFFSGNLFSTTGSPVLIPEGTINERAIRTLFNMLFICVFLSVIDGIRKRVLTQKPVNKILDALSKITKGDFTVRPKPLHKKEFFDEYDLIIEDINKMAQELSSIETLKTDFISNVSHEIKTPLSVIHNYSVMLKNENLTMQERIEYASRLEAASEKLSNLITGILKLNKLENQQIFTDKTTFNLSEQLCQAILIYENEWEEKEIELIIDFDESIEVTSYEELFFTVWSNLMSNAVKFTESKGQITVTLKKEGSYAVVSFSDTGCGMTAEIKKRIFEKFYQGDSSHATNGNGIGLALVNRIINITESEITVASEVGRGSVFTVRVPLY